MNGAVGPVGGTLRKKAGGPLLIVNVYYRTR